VGSLPPLICHVVYRLAVGGLENGVVNLINHLPQDAFRHAIICVTEATDFQRRIRRPGVAIYELHKKPGKDIAAYGRMWRLLRELRPKIVHTRNLPALDMLAPAWFADVPRAVHSEHGRDMLELDGKSRRYNALRGLSRVMVDHYITVSRELGNWLRNDIGLPKSRVETIYNGVDTILFSPDGKRSPALPPDFAPPGSVTVGTIGRLESVKNPLGLVRAFCRALEMRPELRQVLRLAIIGDGAQRGDIEAALASANARELVWMPGFRDDTPGLYRSFDLFALPSLREGISNTVLEAMASGLPVIATRVGGNPEILPENIAGRLVPVSDDAAMATAILDYVDNPELIRRHGERGRAHVLNQFSLSAMVASYDRVYRSLV
jgi:sugar transferase (PEP-CTERM/EpsH1 system associated)